ncbi:MAG: ribonuclease R [Clostridia bacterium]|nr:ribonuclease R [Clostridia bacterium]
MDRKDRIFAFMNQEDYVPLTRSELALVLCVPDSDLDEFSGILDELISDGKIFLSKKNRYAVCEKNLLFPGVLRTNPRGRFGFVTCENFPDDIYIPKDSLGTAIDSDRVLVKITGKERGRYEGAVKEVLERNNTTISAVLDDNFCAIADNPRIFGTIKITDMNDAKAGERVLLELTDYAKNGDIYAQVVSILGSSRDIKTLTEAIIFEHNITKEFLPEALQEADSFPDEISESDLSGRLDLTGETIFTIDGDDARDFDDAVSLKTLENGNFELGVHIADVTHYVTPNSALENDASQRATSVYLPDRVIPMLPERLSNGLCSLNPNVKRLTISVIMEIDKNGQVLANKIAKSVICSCERMTYNNVAKIFDGDSELRERYSHIVPTLENMLKLSKILAKRREMRGSINFDFPESKVVLGEDGFPKDIIKVVRNDAHKLIEEFMLVANETVAEYAFWSDIPFVYRVHQEPDGEKIESFRRFIGGFGLYIKGNEVYPKDLQQILDEVKDTPNEVLIGTYMLRSLMKAEYLPVCDGHFGLATKYYCHFTSPIRRYPDLIIHRILKDFLDGKDVSGFHNIVGDASTHSSEKEREAELCERDTTDLLKAAYIADFVGCKAKATISGVTSFGIFAELENTVEGLIRLETIKDDFYEFDEDSRMIIGKRHGKVYKIGDEIEIEIVRADLLSRQIDFVLKGHRQSVRKRPEKKHSVYRRYKKNKRGRRNG